MILTIAFCILAFGACAAIALVRGLSSFLRRSEGLKTPSNKSLLENAEHQNRMMMQRVFFQGLAVLAVAILGLFAARS
jgi:hypothetical protein